MHLSRNSFGKEVESPTEVLSFEIFEDWFTVTL